MSFLRRLRGLGSTDNPALAQAVQTVQAFLAKAVALDPGMLARRVKPSTDLQPGAAPVLVNTTRDQDLLGPKLVAWPFAEFREVENAYRTIVPHLGQTTPSSLERQYPNPMSLLTPAGRGLEGTFNTLENIIQSWNWILSTPYLKRQLPSEVRPGSGGIVPGTEPPGPLAKGSKGRTMVLGLTVAAALGAGLYWALKPPKE